MTVESASIGGFDWHSDTGVLTPLEGSNKNPVGYIKDSGMCHVENYTILTFKAWELSYDY